MKKIKSRKSALLSSLFALILCFAMLLGTTFAWFSDTVTSSLNQIKAGKLDVGMNYWNSESSAYEDASNVPLFDNNALWEPGYVDIAYLEIENRANLSFNFLFAVYPTEETPGYLKNGKTFFISDYLTYAIIPYNVEVSGEIESRQKAMELIADVEMGLTQSNYQVGTINPGQDSVKLALIVYMPTDVTSDQANHDHKSGKPYPQVRLAVDVYATQNTFEYDSFDNLYDKGLQPSFPKPIWRYTPEGYEVDAENKKITINTVEALKYLGTLYNDMKIHPLYDPSEWEIVLGNDMDFGGEVITKPLSFGGFKSFDGNNKTITNVILNYIYVDEEIKSVGLFDELPSTKNLTLENVTVTSEKTAAGVLAGNLIGESYEGITISDCTISGYGFIGGLIGWGNFLLPIDFSGCQLLNPNISLFGSSDGSAGGIAGYAGGSNVTVNNTTVKGLDASGVTASGSYVGGMFGELNADAIVNNSTVTEITIYKDVYIGSITGKIYDEKVVSVNKTTIAVQAKDKTTDTYVVIPVTSDGELEENELQVDTLGFPQSALHTAYNGHYYQVLQQRVNWNVAYENCINMNGHLVTISSAEENAAVARIVHNHGGSTWLGGMRSAEDYNKFVWITGEPMNYTNWESGEPNNYGSQGETVIHMYADDGKWNDYNVGNTDATAYACEWDSLQSYLNYLTATIQ